MSTALRALLLVLLCVAAVPLAKPVLASEPGNTFPAFDKAAILQPQNRSTYHIFIEDKDGQTIDIYNHPSGVFIPIDPLLQKLGYQYQRDDNDKLLQVTFPDKTTLIIRFGKNEYIRNGETGTLQDSDFIYNGVDIYLNYDLINKTFPIGLSLDQANAKLHVVLKQCEPPPPAAQAKADDFPVPQAAPTVPVIVDSIGAKAPPPALAPAATPAPAAQEQTKIAEVAKPPEQPPPPTATPPPKESKADDEDNPNEEEPLVLQPKIKNNPPSDQFIEAVAVGDRLYLPLGDMAKMLEFDIKIDDAAGTAEGSFITPDQNFSLNVKNQTVAANHQSFALTADSTHMRNGQLYVNAEDFKKWFGITCVYDRKFMTLAMTMDFTLPVEARDARHATWNKLMMSQNQVEKNMTPYQTPYQLASAPFIDVNLNAGYSTMDQQHTTGNYTVLGAGDLGYLTTDVYASGTNQSPLDNLRITAGRKDPDGNLLGPMGATQFSVGDIDSPALNLVTNNNLGRGFSVSNRSLMAADNFDSHTITGNAVPGWEVELYRNNLLLGFQTVDSNGRYEFLNQPLIYGVNNFRVVLYGPQGQIEDHVESVMVGSSMLKPGQVEYTFSANQEAASMIQFDKINGSITSTSDQPQGLRMVGDTRVGVTKFLTLGMGAAQTELPDGYHRYATTLADLSFLGIYTEANYIKDMNNGYVGGITAITSVDDVSIRMLHRQYHDFTSEVETLTDPGNFRKTVSEMDLNSQIYVPLLQDFNVGASAQYETFTNDVPHTTYTGTISKNVLGMSFTNGLNYIIESEKQLQGVFGMQTRFDNIMFRADGTYNIDPTFGLHDAAFTAQYRIDNELSAQSQIDKGLDQDTHTTFTQTLNRDIDSYRLSLTTQVNNQLQYMFGISMVFSLAHDDANGWTTRGQNMANSGAIEPRVFVDNHYDGIYHDDDPIVSDAGVRINGVSTPDNADKHFIAPVSAYQPVNVDVDISTIKDPMLSPETDGYRVSTRPGDIAKLDLPLIATSEIDGAVSIVDEKGARYQIPDIVVEMQNANGKLLRRVMAESDGYYIFDKIKPGDYIITIPPEALAHYHAEINNPIHIKIDKVTDFRTGNDIILKATGPLPPNLQKWEK